MIARLPLIVVLLVLAIAGCAIAPADSDYNQGVHAYQAKDHADARAHWTRAVAAGDALAKNNLGYLLYDGWGGAKDEARALVLWREAAATTPSTRAAMSGVARAPARRPHRMYIAASRPLPFRHTPSPKGPRECSAT